MKYSAVSAALDVTNASARVALPGGSGQMLRVTLSAVATAVRVGINLGDVTVVAALPASGGTSAGMILPAVVGATLLMGPQGATHIAAITDAGTCQLGVSRVGEDG